MATNDSPRTNGGAKAAGNGGRAAKKSRKSPASRKKAARKAAASTPARNGRNDVLKAVRELAVEVVRDQLKPYAQQIAMLRANGVSGARIAAKFAPIFKSEASVVEAAIAGPASRPAAARKAPARKAASTRKAASGTGARKAGAGARKAPAAVGTARKAAAGAGAARKKAAAAAPAGSGPASAEAGATRVPAKDIRSAIETTMTESGAKQVKLQDERFVESLLAKIPVLRELPKHERNRKIIDACAGRKHGPTIEATPDGRVIVLAPAA